jgi:hypothetical protein
MKVGVWYEARLKGNERLRIVVCRPSEEEVKHYTNGGSYVSYSVITVDGSRYGRIVPENWDFRELSALEQELE